MIIKCPKCSKVMSQYYARRFGMCKECVWGEEE